MFNISAVTKRLTKKERLIGVQLVWGYLQPAQVTIRTGQLSDRSVRNPKLSLVLCLICIALFIPICSSYGLRRSIIHQGEAAPLFKMNKMN